MARMSRDLCANEQYLDRYLAELDKEEQQERFSENYIAEEREAIEKFVAGHGFLEQFIEDNMELVDSELENRAKSKWERLREEE